MKRWQAVQRSWPRFSPWFTGLLAVAAFAAGALIVYWAATPWGPWAYSDATAYIHAARNFVQGEGLGFTYPSGRFQPLAHYPPFFPLIISALLGLGFDAMDGLRLLNMLLFGGLAAGWLLAVTAVTRNLAAGALTGGFVLGSPVLVLTLSGAMSEGPYLALASLGFWALLVYYRHAGLRWAALSGLALGLGFLTRYIGVATLIAGALCLALIALQGWRERIKAVLVYLGVALLPNLIWLAWTSIQVGSPGARQSASVPVIEAGWKYLSLLVEVISSWQPLFGRYYDLVFWPGLILLLAGLALGAWGWLRREPAASQSVDTTPAVWQMALSAALFVAIYLGVLGGAFVFSLPTPDVNDRMLSAIQPFLFCAVVGLCWLAGMAAPWHRKVQAGMLAVLGVFCLGYARAGFLYMLDLRASGLGYNSAFVQSWDIWPALAELPLNWPLISNEPELVLFYTDRFPYHTGTEIYDPLNQYVYGEGADEVNAIFRDQGGLLILLRDDRRGNSFSPELFDQRTRGLHVIWEGVSGGIYTYPQVP